MEKYMKKIFFIIITFNFIVLSYSKSLEYKYNFWGSEFIFIDGEKKLQSNIFNPFIGYINKDLKDILKDYPESYKLIKIAQSLSMSGSIFLGIGVGCLIGPILCFSLSVDDYKNNNGSVNGYTPTDWLAILGFTTSGISILSLIYGIVSEAVYPSVIKKSFEIFNKQNEDTESIKISIFIDSNINIYNIGIIVRM